MGTIATIRDLLGPDVLLLPCGKGTKKPTIKWGNLTAADMSDPKHLSALNRAGNIGVALGHVSGGLCSVDIDDDGWVEPFQQKNPTLRDTTCTRGARGCNLWMRIEGEYPRTHHIKQDGEGVGEFRADKCYTIISGTHPSGSQYQYLNETKPIALPYQSLVWPESGEAKHTTSSVSLNTQYSILHPISSILYNNGTPTSATNTDSVLERIQARRSAVASFKHTHPALVEVYSTLIESRFRGIVGGRNAFVVEAVPFLFRAVAPQFILPLVSHFYRCNQPLFNDSMEAHMQEAQAMLEGVAETYLQELAEAERVIYQALEEREQTLFRICRDLALCGESEDKPPLVFYVPLTRFGQRLGLAGMQVQRDLMTLIGYGIIEQVEKGRQWKEGQKANAGRYRYVLATPTPS